MSVTTVSLSRQEKQKQRALRETAIPFAARITASVADCVEATGISRSALYNLMNAGAVEYRLMGRHRVVVIRSLLKKLGLENEISANQQPQDAA